MVRKYTASECYCGKIKEVDRKINCAISVVVIGEDGISIYMKMRWRETRQRAA
jgi:hypothetical protein